MKYHFRCTGHENILATHKTTIEFTKDSRLTRNGDCIIGVEADFNAEALKKFIASNRDKKIICTVERGSIKDDFTFLLNKEFNDHHEIVIRKSDFLSPRTLGIHATKAAIDLDRNLIAKDKNSRIKVTFTA